MVNLTYRALLEPVALSAVPPLAALAHVLAPRPFWSPPRPSWAPAAKRTRPWRKKTLLDTCQEGYKCCFCSVIQLRPLFFPAHLTSANRSRSLFALSSCCTLTLASARSLSSCARDSLSRRISSSLALDSAKWRSIIC